MASRHSSDRVRQAAASARRRSFRLRLLAAGATLLAAACSTVKPQDKELLADPAMTYGAGGEAAIQQQHVLENREGAAGAGAAGGGGCGCN